MTWCPRANQRRPPAVPWPKLPLLGVVAAPASPTRPPRSRRRFGPGHPPAASSCRDSARSFGRRSGNPAACAPGPCNRPPASARGKESPPGGPERVLSRCAFPFASPAGAGVRARPGARKVCRRPRPRQAPPGRRRVLLRRRTPRHARRADPGRQPIGQVPRTVGRARPNSECRATPPPSPTPGRWTGRGLARGPAAHPDSGPRVMAYSAERGSAAPVMLVMLGLGAHLFARRRPAGASDPQPAEVAPARESRCAADSPVNGFPSGLSS